MSYLDRQRQQEAKAVELASQGSSMARDDRLRLMEELDLKPGPIDFGTRANYEKLEPYSGINLKSRRISFEDFQEVMDGRYHLSPSLLYSIRQRTERGRRQGADGDYDIPVPGDWVVIATITWASPIFTANREDARADDPEEGEGADDDDQDGGYRWKRRPRRDPNRKREHGINHDGGTAWMLDDDDDPVASGVRKERSGRCYKLTDNSRQSDGSKGTDEMKLLCFAADAKGPHGYIGGSKGAYEKLQSQKYGGTVIALINPVMMVSRPNKKSRKEDENIITLKPRDADSVIIIGNTADYATCVARKADGQPCGEYVDKRDLGGRSKADAVCGYHLERSIERAQSGRQEFANGTSSYGGLLGAGVKGFTKKGFGWSGGGKGGGGFGGRRGGKGYDPTKYAQKHFEDKGAHNYTVGVPRGALSFEGLNGKTKNTYIPGCIGDDVNRYAKSDPRNRQFRVEDHYGREAAEKDARARKALDEEMLLRNLEAARSGWSEEVLASQAGKRASQEEAQQQDDDGIRISSNSIGALAILDARKTLADRRELKRKQLEDDWQKKQKALKRRRAANDPQQRDRLAVMGSSESEEESQRRSKDKDKTQDGEEPTAIFSAAQSTGPAPKSRYTAEEIRNIGFDPLSAARARQKRHQATDSTSNIEAGGGLLSRHALKGSALPAPCLKVKKSIPNVRAPPASGMIKSFALKAGNAGAGATMGGIAVSTNSRGDESDSDLEII